MQNPKDNQNSRFHDRGWYFLAEYSLSQLMGYEDIVNEPTAGSLFQATQDLGLPLEVLKSIEGSLIGYVQEAMAHFNQDRMDLQVYIRLFCQKKVKVEIRSLKPSSHFDSESTPEPTKINCFSDTKINGGWGYFLIERGGGDNPDSSESTYYLIDLYLYKEGK